MYSPQQMWTCTLRKRGVHLFSKEASNPLENTVFFGIIGMVLGRNLKQRGEGGSIGVDSMSYAICDLEESQRGVVVYKCSMGMADMLVYK